MEILECLFNIISGVFMLCILFYCVLIVKNHYEQEKEIKFLVREKLHAKIRQIERS